MVRGGCSLGAWGPSLYYYCTVASCVGAPCASRDVMPRVHRRDLSVEGGRLARGATRVPGMGGSGLWGGLCDELWEGVGYEIDLGMGWVMGYGLCGLWAVGCVPDARDGAGEA